MHVQLRQAEIDDLGAVHVQENIRRLDIAMHDAGPMRGIECVGQRDCNVDARHGIERAVTSVAQRLAVQQLHHEERVTVRRLTDVVYGADVRMLQRRDCLRLALKTLASLRGLDQLRRQHLERDIAPEPCVPRAIDLTHTAGTNGSEDLVQVPSEYPADRTMCRCQRWHPDSSG